MAEALVVEVAEGVVLQALEVAARVRALDLVLNRPTSIILSIFYNKGKHDKAFKVISSPIAYINV